MLAVFSSPLADKIPPEGPHGLGSTLYKAAKMEHRLVVREILASSHAARILPEGSYGLGHALNEAARKGHIDIVREISSFISSRENSP